eukprot:CAMPEP_0180641236 /NCGR_PEP_ID=MMETSP1037_2-20121125/46355_1 /TAXON_ID=632150 /ORGANISM="Azadinium spinosum, Strain 3D9" /LENGTH=100 /DNA_ID=CAMNT_0022664027 /DNA_START=98 /DNA_END=400 /DNA_ORIENTATION=+
MVEQLVRNLSKRAHGREVDTPVWDLVRVRHRPHCRLAFPEFLPGRHGALVVAVPFLRATRAQVERHHLQAQPQREARARLQLTMLEQVHGTPAGELVDVA